MKIKNQEGQSTIEFILTFAFGVSVVVMIFNSAMNYAAGYLAHYATFMASRVYLTSEKYSGNWGDVHVTYRQEAERQARQTFERYNLGIFGIPNTAFVINPPTMGSPSEYLMVGGVTSFQRNIDMMGKLLGETKIDLVSESYLGKEPTRLVCAIRTCEAITNQSNCDGLDITLYDDGC